MSDGVRKNLSRCEKIKKIIIYIVLKKTGLINAWPQLATNEERLSAQTTLLIGSQSFLY